MRLELVDQRRCSEPLPLGEDRLAALAEPLGCADWVLNLVLLEDQVMADLNARWYGGEGVTDVLSFTYLEIEGTGLPQLAGGDDQAARDLWVAAGDREPEVTAGEVILAPAFVAERCRKEGWDLPAEWGMLLVHGGLHVLGWLHDTSEARCAMQAQEAELLDRQGFSHPLLKTGLED